MDIAIVGSDWTKAEELIKESSGEAKGTMSARSLALKIDESEEKIPASLRETILTSIESASSPSYLDHPIVARQQLALGQKDLALQAAQKAIEADKRIPEEVTKAFAASFETETPQTLNDFRTAISGSDEEKGRR